MMSVPDCLREIDRKADMVLALVEGSQTPCPELLGAATALARASTLALDAMAEDDTQVLETRITALLPLCQQTQVAASGTALWRVRRLLQEAMELARTLVGLWTVSISGSIGRWSAAR